MSQRDTNVAFVRTTFIDQQPPPSTTQSSTRPSAHSSRSMPVSCVPETRQSSTVASSQSTSWIAVPPVDSTTSPLSVIPSQLDALMLPINTTPRPAWMVSPDLPVTVASPG